MFVNVVNILFFPVFLFLLVLHLDKIKLSFYDALQHSLYILIAQQMVHWQANHAIRHLVGIRKVLCKHPTPLVIQLHPPMFTGDTEFFRNWTFMIFKTGLTKSASDRRHLFPIAVSLCTCHHSNEEISSAKTWLMTKHFYRFSEFS